MKGQQGQGQLGDATISQEELMTIDNALVKAREFLSLSPQLGTGLTKLKEEIVTAEQIIGAKIPNRKEQETVGGSAYASAYSNCASQKISGLKSLLDYFA